MEKPEGQTAIDDLRATAETAEDHAYLDQEQKTFNEERAKALGERALETPHIELSDGTIATPQEVQASIDNGEEPSGPYDGGQR